MEGCQSGISRLAILAPLPKQCKYVNTLAGGNTGFYFHTFRPTEIVMFNVYTSLTSMLFYIEGNLDYIFNMSLNLHFHLTFKLMTVA